MNVWAVMGWDEVPRAIFSSEDAAVEFAKGAEDYEYRQDIEDQSEIDRHYPFVIEYEVR